MRGLLDRWRGPATKKTIFVSGTSREIAPAPGADKRFHTGLNALLSREGVGEDRVQRRLTEERRDSLGTWLETSWEVVTPPGFDGRRFLTKLSRLLAREKMILAEDDRRDDRWILVCGDGRRVYGRLVFTGIPGGGGK
jgi:hypothetical protein